MEERDEGEEEVGLELSRRSLSHSLTLTQSQIGTVLVLFGPRMYSTGGQGVLGGEQYGSLP